MGYTQHWNAPESKCTDAEWDRVKREAQKIFDATDIPIQLEYDESKPPLVDDEVICFNGVEDDGHETFIVYRESPPTSFHFCKTAQKPYDTVCVAILRMLVTELHEFKWTSDGEYSDFADGLELYSLAGSL